MQIMQFKKFLSKKLAFIFVHVDAPKNLVLHSVVKLWNSLLTIVSEVNSNAFFDLCKKHILAK